MEVAAVLLYDRSLNPRERENVEAYLRIRYLEETLPPDQIPPVISVPEYLFAAIESPEGAVVTFAPVAIDGIDGPLSSVSEPASGSMFPPGETTVTTTAIDSAGNVATAYFTVTVAPPEVLVSMIKLEVYPDVWPDTLIRFQTVPGLTYVLLTSRTLSDWENLTTYLGDGQQKTYVHAGGASASRRFYKVGISNTSAAP
jgi:hypothetical protein